MRSSLAAPAAAVLHQQQWPLDRGISAPLALSGTVMRVSSHAYPRHRAGSMSVRTEANLPAEITLLSSIGHNDVRQHLQWRFALDSVVRTWQLQNQAPAMRAFGSISC